MSVRRPLRCIVLLSAISAAAQLTPPPGWTMQSSSGAIIMLSPGEPGSRVAITLLPPGTPNGDVKAWFSKQSLALAQASGRTLGATEVMEESGILVRMVQVENKNQKKLRLILYGYPSAHGFSIPILAMQMTVDEKDPKLETANQYVQQLAAQKFEVATLQSQQQPIQPPQPMPGGSMAPPRSDIDLTYHAKSLIPKERDVPLRGVYVFIGYAYGASYGGVGTTMTWGQRAVQQLLLLFANGVAAKTDLKGDNLAGHHQAEGFATMDVATPAAVSGAPFGRWTEDEHTVHIQWNIGAPTDLSKNGANLEGKGERWTPFQLAEGDRIEGTFVRKMEAGLRSQAIVLHQNGTFSGDGVNVTMGGSIVSPQFPERGSGNYQVHKGSMILAFSNGFTQAIACIIDKAPNGDAKTILLNGFPFERVR
jgi:hypothetical protein